MHLPEITSFVLADQVFRQESRKWCVIGVFSKIYCPMFPAMYPSFGVFVVIADAEGDYDLRLEMRNSKDQLVTKMDGLRLTGVNRRDQCEFGMQTHNLPIPAAGRYFFKLFFRGEPALRDAYFDAEIMGGQNGGS